MIENRSENDRKGRGWICLGLLGILVIMAPYFLLGQDSVVTYHDQLDGELIAYILQARHLFRGNILPEFMNGASKTALTLPAPFFVLFFLGGNAYWALTAMALLEKMCGFLGMYLLVREFVEEKWIAAGTGFLYGCLPFLPVYGMSQFGIPMLLWCMLQLRKGSHMLAAWCYAAFYALSSSLVLAGFGILGMGLLWILWDWAVRKQAAGAKRLLTAWLLMLGIYIAENCRLLGQLLGLGEEFISHKSVYEHSAVPFGQVFLQSFLKGEQHSRDSHTLFLGIIFLSLAAGLALRHRLFRDGRGQSHTASFVKKLQIMGICLGCNVFFCVTTAIWNSGAGVFLRSRLFVLGAVQIDRLLWMAPCMWYLAAACGMGLAWNVWLQAGRREENGRTGLARLAAGLWVLVFAAAAGVTGIWLLLAGDFKSNLQKLRNPEYPMLSYQDYYALGVMEQVKEFLGEASGQEPEAYRVVSLGIAPAVALYHGFYCLDGYSNNYSLAYKEQFRRVIAPELEKSDYLREYYDGWGNRCYLFSAEIPGYVTVEKNGFFFQDYCLDTKALYEMGGRYLLSAAYILNAEELGLSLMNETPFETPDSYYRIFVYSVEAL